MVTITNLILTAVLAVLGLGSALPPRIGTTMLDSGNSPRLGNGRTRSNRRAIPTTASTSPGQSAGHVVDIAYVTPVTIGTPPQALNLDFDTASSLRSVGLLELHARFPVLSGHTWSITYSDGSAYRGDVYTDNFTQVSSSFTSVAQIDGLLGLGFSSLNTPRVYGRLEVQGHWKLRLWLHRPGQVHREITHVPINTNPGYWIWTSTGFVGSGNFVSTSITGIADTGTHPGVPAHGGRDGYDRQVSGASNSQYYGGYAFPLHGDAAALHVRRRPGAAHHPGVPTSTTRAWRPRRPCAFGRLQSSSGLGIDVWGAVALKAAIVVFNGGSNPPTIGWAAKTLVM
ncbi:hypothetical protein VTK56DRAFT_10213 [Thermocarpiscus australiensis]